MSRKREDDKEVSFNAYSVIRGHSPLHYKLISLKMKGKMLNDVEIVLEEILPLVLAKASEILHQEGKQNEFN